MSTAIAAAKNGVGTELLRHRGLGSHLLTVRNKGSVAAVVALERQRLGVISALLPEEYTKHNAAESGYVADGTTATFTAEALTDLPIVPGTFELAGTSASPKLADLDKDGNLYFALVGARKAGSSGSFAAMASEVMTLEVDGDLQTITFGTEASIALAVAAMNLQLKGATAVATDANNVAIDSDSIGSGSSVEVITVAAGITTKLGISVGVETSIAGTLNYFSGALELAYPGGYSPDADESNLAVVTGTTTGPWDMAPGDTLVVDTDAGGDETATFDAAAAIVLGSGGAFAAMASETMGVAIDGGDVQTVTFGTEATIELAMELMNVQLAGCHVELVDANNLAIHSDSLGTGAQVVTSAVAAGITTKIGIADAASEVGTGDVVDINAVTAAEVKTVVEADTTDLTVNVVAGRVQLTAATSVNVNATSDLETILGLSTTLASAGTGVGTNPLTVSFLEGVSIEAQTSETFRFSNLLETDELVVYGAGDDDGVRLEAQVVPN